MTIMWRKICRDLWFNKARTFLIVLSTAVGVFALGFVFGTSDVMQLALTASHEASVFPHLVFYTGLFDVDDQAAVLDDPGIAVAEGLRVATFRWKKEGDQDWSDGILYARHDYGEQRTDIFDLTEGRWPEGRELAVERLSSRQYGIPIGSSIIVEFGRSERRLPIQGRARQSQVVCPQ